MNRLLTLFILQSVFLSLVQGQSLLMNPDFELYYDFPDQAGEWNQCVGWNAMHNPNFFTTGSPDYCHVDGDYPVQMPYGCFAASYIPPHSGDAAVGLITYSGPMEGREYLMTRLIHPLEIGREYSLSFWISNGEPNYSLGYVTGGMSCDKIGVLLSTDSVIQYGTEVVNRQPQFVVNEDFFSATWKQYSFSFVADSAYRYLSMGNFFPNSQTNSILTDSALGSRSYIFFDDFTFDDPIDDFSGSPLTLPNVFTPNGDVMNDGYVVSDSLGFEMFELVIFNRWGNEVFKTNESMVSWDGNSDGKPCKEGVYFWKLIYRRPGGEDKLQSGFLNLIR